MAVRKFQKSRGGQTGGVYTCRSCGKKTRETGEGESGCELCLYCFEESGWENHHSDNGHDPEVHPFDCLECKAAGCNMAKR